MVRVTFNHSENRLIITMAQNFTADDAKELHSKLKEIAPELKKGFSVITDLSGLKSMDTDTRHFIERIMDLLNEHGVSRVARVIPDPTKDIGFNIMRLFHYSMDVLIHNCTTLKEAEKILK